MEGLRTREKGLDRKVEKKVKKEKRTLATQEYNVRRWKRETDKIRKQKVKKLERKEKTMGLERQHSFRFTKLLGKPPQSYLRKA